MIVIRQPFLIVDGVLQHQDGVLSVRAERVEGVSRAAPPSTRTTSIRFRSQDPGMRRNPQRSESHARSAQDFGHLSSNSWSRLRATFMPASSAASASTPRELSSL